MKKIFALALTLALTLTLTACTAGEPPVTTPPPDNTPPPPEPGGGGIVFSLDTSAAQAVVPGQELDIPVIIRNNPNGFAVGAVILTLPPGLEWRVRGSYDQNDTATWPFLENDITLLQLPEHLIDSALESGILRIPFINGILSPYNYVGDGTLVTLRLRVSSSAVPGEELQIGLELDGEVVSVGQQSPETVAIPGSVKVEG
jgi:hypothetical protein